MTSQRLSSVVAGVTFVLAVPIAGLLCIGLCALVVLDSLEEYFGDD